MLANKKKLFLSILNIILISFIVITLYGWVWSIAFNSLFHLTKNIPTPSFALQFLLHSNYKTPIMNLTLWGLLLAPFALLLFSCLSNLYQNQQLAVYGNARWATYWDMWRMGLLKRKGLIVGYTEGFLKKFIQIELKSHALLFAPSRSGKGVGKIIPNVLLDPDSLLVIDMKLEVFEATSGYRQKCGHKVYLFAPTEPHSHAFNPLDLVSNDPHKLVSDLQLITHILIRSQNPDMWIREARTLALGLLIWLKEHSGRPFSIPELNFLIKGTQDFTEFLTSIVNSSISESSETNLHPIVFTSFNNFIQKAVKEQSGVKTTLASCLGLWDDPYICAATSHSDFDISQMRKERITIYLGIPFRESERLSPLMSLVIQFFLNKMSEKLPSSQEPYHVKVYADELCNFGKMDILKSALSYIAGYHVHIIAIIQNVAQFYELYGIHGSDVFFQNIDYKMAYQQNTRTDQEFVSNQLGNRGVRVYSRSTSGGIDSRPGSLNQSIIQRPLLSADEVRSFSKDKGILMVKGGLAVKFKKIVFYNDKIFKKLVIKPIQIPANCPSFPNIIAKRIIPSFEQQNHASKKIQTLEQELEKTVLEHTIIKKSVKNFRLDSIKFKSILESGICTDEQN